MNKTDVAKLLLVASLICGLMKRPTLQMIFATIAVLVVVDDIVEYFKTGGEL